MIARKRLTDRSFEQRGRLYRADGRIAKKPMSPSKRSSPVPPASTQRSGTSAKTSKATSTPGKVLSPILDQSEGQTPIKSKDQIMTVDLASRLSDELFDALRNRAPIPLISARHPELDIDEAYRISLGVLERRQADGERLVGKKIGLTAKAVQQMVGVDEPDFGFLTNAMQFADGGTVTIADSMMTPMVEAEIALVLKSTLPTDGVTPEMVMDATEFAAASLEIVDTRFDTPKITIVDTVADNASSALFVLGKDRVDPREVDLVTMKCELFRNGDKLSQGLGAAVLGSPFISAAWLANRLGAFGVALEAGDVVLPGSLVPFAPIAAGDTFVAEFEGLGLVSATFA
ncbi:fumarylacetoacetate hydrolase family protein [Novosphingobium sp. ZN18A2]|uniref:2-keto-4-pentenoate hydratase n=1 Tax=Novosphingobium sp. ZN18A2 TaxID=3079861 RepID=UPI0030D2C0F0